MSTEYAPRFSNNISHIEMDLFIDQNNSITNSNTMTSDKNPGFNLRFYPSMVDDNIRDNISTLTPEGSHGEQGKIYIPTTVRLEKTRLKKVNINEKQVLNSLYHTLQYINSFPKKASLDELYDIVEHNIEYILDLYLPPGEEIFLRRGKNAGKIHPYGFDKYTINFAKWKKYKASSQQKLELKNKLTNLQLTYDKSKSSSIDFSKKHSKSDDGYETLLDKSEEIKALYSEQVDEFNNQLTELYNLMQQLLKDIENRNDMGFGYIPDTKSDKQEKYYGSKKSFKQDIKNLYLHPNTELTEGPFLFTLQDSETNSHKLIKSFDDRLDNSSDFISLKQFMALMINRTEKTIKEISYGITAYTFYHLKYMYGTPISDYDSNNVILSAANSTIHRLNLLTKENLTPISIKCNYPTAIYLFETFLFIGYSNGLLTIKNISDINNVQDLLSSYPLNNQPINNIHTYTDNKPDIICSIILNNNDNNINLFNLSYDGTSYKLSYNYTYIIYSGSSFSKLKLNNDNIQNLNIFEFNNLNHVSFFTDTNFYYLSKDNFNLCYPLLVNDSKISSYHVFYEQNNTVIMIGNNDGFIDIYIEDSYDKYYMDNNRNEKLLPIKKNMLHNEKILSINHIKHNDNLYIVTTSTDNTIVFTKLIISENNIELFKKDVVVYCNNKISLIKKGTNLYFNIGNNIFKLNNSFVEEVLEKIVKREEDKLININNSPYFIKLHDDYKNILVNNFTLDDEYLYSYNNKNPEVCVWSLTTNKILKDSNGKLKNIIDENIENTNYVENLLKGEVINGDRQIHIVTKQQLYYYNIDKPVLLPVSINNNYFYNWYMPNNFIEEEIDRFELEIETNPNIKPLLEKAREAKDNIDNKENNSEIISTASYNNYSVILNSYGHILVHDNTSSNNLNSDRKLILCNNDSNIIQANEIIDNIDKSTLHKQMKEKLKQHINDIEILHSTPIQNILSYGFNYLGMKDKLSLFYRTISHHDGNVVTINKINHVNYSLISKKYKIRSDSQETNLKNKSEKQKKRIYILSGGFTKSVVFTSLYDELLKSKMENDEITYDMYPLKLWKQDKYIELINKLIVENDRGNINIKLNNISQDTTIKNIFKEYLLPDEKLYLLQLPKNLSNIFDLNTDYINFKLNNKRFIYPSNKHNLLIAGANLLIKYNNVDEPLIVSEIEFANDLEKIQKEFPQDKDKNIEIINNLGQIEGILYKYDHAYYLMHDHSELISNIFRDLLVSTNIISPDDYSSYDFNKQITHLLLEDRKIMIIGRIEDYSILCIMPFCDISHKQAPVIQQYIEEHSKIFKLSGIISRIEYNKKHNSLIYSINDKLIMRNIDDLLSLDIIELDDEDSSLKHGENGLYEQLTTNCLSKQADKAHDTDIVALSCVENYIISKSLTDDKKSYSLKSWENNKETNKKNWDRTSELCITTYSDGLTLDRSPILVYKEPSIFDELENLLKKYFDKETVKMLQKRMNEINKKLGINYKKYKELETNKNEFRKLWSKWLGKDFYKYPISSMWKDIETSNKRQPSTSYGLDLKDVFIGTLEEAVKNISDIELLETEEVKDIKTIIEKATTESEIYELYNSSFNLGESSNIGSAFQVGGSKEEDKAIEKEKKRIEEIRTIYNRKLKNIFPKYYDVENMVRDLTAKEIISEIENLIKLKQYCLDASYKNIGEKTLKKIIDKFEKKNNDKNVLTLEIKRLERETNIQKAIKQQHDEDIKQLKTLTNELKKYKSTSASNVLDLLIKRLKQIKDKKVKELEEEIKELNGKKAELNKKLIKNNEEEIISDKKYTKQVLGKIYIALLKGHGIVDEVKYKDANVENNKIKLYQAQHEYNAALGGWSNKYRLGDEKDWTTNKLFPAGYKIDIDLAVIPYDEATKYPYMQSRFFKCAEKAKDVDNNLSKLLGVKTDWAKDLLYGTPFKSIQNALSNNLLRDVPFTTDKQKAAFVASKSKLKDTYKKRAAAQKKLGILGATDAKSDLKRYLNKQILEEQAKQLVKQMSKDELLKDMGNLSLDDIAGGKKIIKDKRRIRNRKKYTQRNKKTNKHNKTINKGKLQF